MSAHNATAFPPSSTSSKTPAATAAVVYGQLLNNMFTYGDAFNKVAPQYRVLTGVPEPVKLPAPGSNFGGSKSGAPLIAPPSRPRPDGTSSGEQTAPHDDLATYPSAGAIDDVKDWVQEPGELSRQDRAAYAIFVESQRSQPRSTLMVWLERVIAEDDDAVPDDN